MRGRTNASNGGIFLNATTDDFEVATGNTIVAGDFVEYHYDTEIKSLVSTFGANSYLVDGTTHTYIALIGGYPTLYTYIDKTITVVATYQTASSCLIQLDSTHYFVFNDTTKKVGLISCTASAITLIDEASSANSSAESFVGVNVTTMVYKHNNSNLLYVASTDANYTSVSVTSKNLINNTYSIAGATSTEVILCRANQGSSNYTNYFYLYDAEDFTQTGSFQYVTNDYSLRFLPNIVFNDRYILAYYTYKSVSTVTRYYQNMCIFDTVDKQLVATLGFTDYSLAGASFVVSPINSQNEYVVKEGQYMYWVKFDSALSSLTKSEYTVLDQSGAIYGFDAHNFALLINNQGYINFDTLSGKVVIGTPTDTVQEWAGSGNPLGVAKQSGTAGDTIEVYIPQVNS